MIIGITGQIGSGKSLASQYLVEKYGFTEYSFAGPLKEIGRIFKFEEHQLYGSQAEKLEINRHWGVSGREFLQKLGTDVFRNHLPQVLPDMFPQGSASSSPWVRLFEITVRENPGVNYVISDVRFLDETNSIRRMGGSIVRLIRDCSNTGGPQVSHSSELEMSRITPNYVISNNSSVEHLFSRLDQIITFELLGHHSKGDTESPSL